MYISVLPKRSEDISIFKKIEKLHYLIYSATLTITFCSFANQIMMKGYKKYISFYSYLVSQTLIKDWKKSLGLLWVLDDRGGVSVGEMYA